MTPIKAQNKAQIDGQVNPLTTQYDTAPKVVMTFAASDPGSGAGLQADALTIAALQAHPVTVVTGLTVQDTVGVYRFEALTPDWIVEQAMTLLKDMPIAAFKTGVLGSVAVVKAVAQIASEHPDIPLIVDPVLASGRGDGFGKQDVMDAMVRYLLPHTHLITPNLPEAFALTGYSTRSEAAQALLQYGCKSVLLTGTHDPDTWQVINELYQANEDVLSWAFDRLPGEYHGSGCTLASACATYMAQGHHLKQAVELALQFTIQALSNAWSIGHGQWVPNRFFKPNTP